MFVLCSCGKMVYFLDDECDGCGKKLDISDNDAIKDSTDQMRMVFDA